MKWLITFLLAVPLWAQTAPVSRPHAAVPPDVRRGEKVRVRVTCGGVLLQFDADAESSAHIGENVIVKNPENGRRFVARVEDKGKVFVKK
ncbi:MAG TPA: flagella basal body P-ring formation protein FlgA [Bryobacteraceae bacterium]|jgi:flagella basal body P-ring formation protein FlgA